MIRLIFCAAAVLCLGVNCGTCVAQTASSASSSMQAEIALNLPFLDGAGTLARDTSGNNFNCVLQSSPGRTPAWTASGLSFLAGQGCDLPPAVNNLQTWCFAFNAAPLPPTSDFTGTLSGLLFSNMSDGRFGLNLLTQYIGSETQAFYSDIYAPSILSGNETKFNPAYGYVGTSANTTFVGATRLCYVLGTPGTSLDHIYLNGAETPYAVQNASVGLQTSSFLSLGSANTSTWAQAGSTQTLFRVLGFTGALTLAQVQAADQYLLSDLASRQPVVAAVAQSSTTQLIFDGDSLTVGYGLADPSTVWRKHLSAVMASYDQELYAISGATALGLESSEPLRIAPLCKSSRIAGVTVWDGTNDLKFFSSAGPVTVASTVLSQVSQLAAAGCKVFLFTMVSRTGPAGDGGNFEAEREQVNQLLRANGKAYGAFGVIDIAAQPWLGATGAFANPSAACFQADGTHPSDLCQQYIASTVNHSSSFYAGSTLKAPSIYSTSNALLSSDRVVDARTCSATCNFTLPDGTGPSGETYTILTGARPTSVQGITIYGYTQTVNGSSEPVVLPANSTVKLQIVPLAQSSAGIRWQM